MVSDEFATDPPQPAEISRLWRALFLSFILHAAILAWWKAPPKPMPIGGNPALSVDLGNPYQQKSTMPEPVTETVEHKTPILQGTSPATQFAISESIRPETNQIVKKHTQETRDPAGGVHSLSPGEINVVLVIGEDGHVRDIVWQQLPALSQEQLDRLERGIRRKFYPSSGKSYVSRELVNIRSYLESAQ